MDDLLNIENHAQEACQIYGHFYIKKVPGNFQISFNGKGQAAMVFLIFFNISNFEFPKYKMKNQFL